MYQLDHTITHIGNFRQCTIAPITFNIQISNDHRLFTNLQAQSLGQMCLKIERGNSSSNCRGQSTAA